MKRIVALAVILCVGCSTTSTVKDIAGEYLFSFDNGEQLESLPSITLFPDSSFEYLVPGLGGPYLSKGIWTKAKRGIQLATEFSCIGANIKYIGQGGVSDSIDVYVSFLEQPKIPTQIYINNNLFLLGDSGYFRTIADVLKMCTFITDGFEYYPLCSNHCPISNGNKYSLILLNNPYYPIINSEVWKISEDGTLDNGICKFRKKHYP